MSDLLGGTTGGIRRFIGKKIAMESSEMLMTQQGPQFPVVVGLLKGVHIADDMLEVVVDGDHESSFFILRNCRSVRPPPSDIAIPRRTPIA